MELKDTRSDGLNKYAMLLLIIGLPLSIMTQLRMSCCNVGPGETLLMMWVSYCVVNASLTEGNFYINRSAKYLILFWIIIAITMAIGSYFGHSLYFWDYSRSFDKLIYHGPLHDSVAYIGLFLMTVLLCSYKLKLNDLYMSILLMAIISSVSMYLLLLFYEFDVSLESYRLVGTNAARFSGLARNPNQTSLLVMFVPFLVLSFVEYKNKTSTLTNINLILLSIVIAMSFLVGLKTLSTAYIVSMFFGVVVTFVVWIWIKIKSEHYLDGAVKVLFVSLAVSFILNISVNKVVDWVTPKPVSTIVVQNNTVPKLVKPIPQKSLFDKLSSEVKALIAKIDEKSGFRLKLWKNGYLAISESPIFGLGPGAYSGDDEPFAKREVHNSLIDWMVNSGIIGGIAIVLLFAWGARKIWSAQCYFLFVGLVVLATFSIFHHILRHPIVWAYFVFALKIADEKRSQMTSLNT